MRLPGPVGLILVMVLTTLFVPLGAQAAARPFTLHVSPTGDDTHPGTASQPLRTLTAARDRLRAEPDRDRPFIVELHAGRFELDTSFHLGAADSGTAEAPITYRARPGAVLTGARTVPTEAIEPVADPTIRARLDPSVRDRVRQINLRTLGITDPVTRAPQVTGADRPTGVQLIQGAVMGHDARYPDRGEQLKIAAVQSDGQRPVWRIDDRTPFAWAPSPDLWVEGYPGFDWAYQMQRVLAMNPTNATITLDTPAEFGSKAGQPFHFRHVLEALNQPDEFFTDEPRGLMYFLPTGDPLTLTILSDPLIVGEGVNHVHFEGLEVTGTRGDGMRITQGRGIRIQGGTFHNLGLQAINLDGMTESTVDSVRIAHVGRGGVSMAGGDRQTLSPGNNTVSNNTITRFSETYPRYSPGVTLAGVGNIARNNEIFDAPHLAIQLRGNDHRIESNYVHDVVLDASDSGALHGGRDWTERGNVIENNVFTRVGNGAADVPAIYLDDMMSGTTVRQNVITDSAVGVQHNGRDNVVTSNILVRTQRPVYVGNWSTTISGPGGELERRLREVPYQSPAWAKYPHLANILNDSPQHQKYNTITSNALIESGAISVEEATPGGVQQQNNRALPAAAISTDEKTGRPLIPEQTSLRGVPGLQLPALASVGPHAQGRTSPDQPADARVGLIAAGAGVGVLGVGTAIAWLRSGRSRRGARPRRKLRGRR